MHGWPQRRMVWCPRSFQIEIKGGGAKVNAKGAKEKGEEEENLKAKDARETPNLQVTKAKSPASTSTTGMGIADLRTGVIIATKLKEGKGKRHLL